jgi:uncharacterized protein YdiU (UPF0061 family)
MTSSASDKPTSPRFEHSYRQLSAVFFRDQQPTAVAKPEMIQLNQALAEELNLNINWLQSEQGLLAMAGNAMPGEAHPIATAYSGHQFGSWNPTLGDGRAILLGEVISRSGQRYDFQLKGAGTTPYSRQGDGRSPLGPALREYILSEAMAAIGIPTTRSLAVVSTGERVAREQMLPGGILTRIAKSHLRIGSFEYAMSLNDSAKLTELADYTLERLFPDCQSQAKPYMAMLQAMVERQAKLVAQWQAVGFVHGVMNTDNILLSGETVDYGPCAFLDHYDPDAVFSSIDRNGRYAYKNQPAISQWNLMVFAQALLPILGDDKQQTVDEANEVLGSFVAHYDSAYAEAMAKKIGFNRASTASEQLSKQLLELMQQYKLDFTQTFSRLTQLIDPEQTISAEQAFSSIDSDTMAAIAPWLASWQQAIDETLLLQQLSLADISATMQQANPLYIPRNHLVEAALHAAVYENQLAPFYQLIDCLTKPYQRHANHDYFVAPPAPEQVVRATFCGT